MRSLWITLTLGLTVFLSGETVSFLLGTPREEPRWKRRWGDKRASGSASGAGEARSSDLQTTSAMKAKERL